MTIGNGKSKDAGRGSGARSADAQTILEGLADSVSELIGDFVEGLKKIRGGAVLIEDMDDLAKAVETYLRLLDALRRERHREPATTQLYLDRVLESDRAAQETLADLFRRAHVLEAEEEKSARR
jgi:hypothetical protein